MNSTNKSAAETIYTISNEFGQLQDNKKDEQVKPADFERAISATGFGKFNYMLLTLSIPAAWSTVLDASSMSYVFPAAYCDLSLTLLNKGMLNAITYVGMISSAFLWGFLADTLGRKKLLIYGYLLDAVCNVFCAMSQTFWMLLSFKFLSGFIICGPFPVLMSYLSEFHSAKHRSRIILTAGIFCSSGNLILPCLAWIILPQQINTNVMDYLVIHSWNVFIFVCTIPVFFAGFGYMFLPESPKFLMTMGKNDEALSIFKKVYALNTGNLPENYPIKKLVEEINENNNTYSSLDSKVVTAKITANRNNMQALKEGWQQIRPLFYPPYFKQMILTFLINFGILLGLNTLRLWLPQLFKSIDEYEQTYPDHINADLCDMLAFSSNSTGSIETGKCEVIPPNDQVYINSIITAICSMVSYLLVGSLVNILGQKPLMLFMLAVSSIFGFVNYWSVNWIMAVVCSTIYVSLMGICCTTLISAVVDIFPTSLRAMTISLSMMCGRVGSILGNLLFPLLLQNGCFPPFLMLGGICLMCMSLTCGIRTTASQHFK